MPHTHEAMPRVAIACTRQINDPSAILGIWSRLYDNNMFYIYLYMAGVSDQKCGYDSMDLATAESNINVEPHFSPHFLSLLEIIMDEDSLHMPTTPLEALDLYLHLTDSISSMLD